MYENEKKGRILPTFVTFSPNTKPELARIFSRSPRDRLHISDSRHDSRSFHSCREIVAFDSSLDFMVGWLPLLYVFLSHTKERKERRDVASRTRGNAFLPLPQVATRLFYSTNTRPKNSMRNRRITFDFPAIFGYSTLYSTLFLYLIILSFSTVSSIDRYNSISRETKVNRKINYRI